MSNEEKILKKLEQISLDIDSLKSRVSELEHSGEHDGIPSIEQQVKAIDGLSHLLDDEEKKSFGAFMDTERARKERIYG